MKTKNIYKLLFSAVLLIAGNTAWAQLTIIGPDTVCLGETVEYTVSPASPSDVYNWFGTGAIGTGSATTNETFTFTAESPPLANVTIFNTTTPGYAFKNVYVEPRPNLYISSNFRVGCRNLITDTIPIIDHDDELQDMLDDSICVKVCENSIVRYYANGVGETFEWTVTGPELLHDWGDSIEVQWGMTGTSGSIKLSTTTLCGYFERNICAEVVENPEAAFGVKPGNGPAENFEACVNTEIIFEDLSSGSKESPIVSWLWNFGDGNFSAQQNPTHAYTTSGNYEIILTVRNACNCVDTYKVNVTVNAEEGPPIDCPSIVCENETVTYTTSVSCSNYQWAVEGGTIVSGGGPFHDFVEVEWANVPGNFGYVSLATPGCTNICEGTTVVKVPVINSRAEIVGPDDLCTGRQYEYSLPLWPGMRWNWGVIGNPSAVVGPRNDHKMVVRFSSPGTYQLHGTYQNILARCGGDTVKTVTVKATTQINGDRAVCAGETKTYTLSPSATADWTLRTPSGPIHHTGNSFTANFTEIGDYVLIADGEFCISPISITVFGDPPQVDKIEGEDQVCLGKSYTYTAGNNASGYVFKWEAVGGTQQPSDKPDEVTVIWTNSSGRLKVWREHAGGAPCPGSDTMIMDIMEDPINPVITGPDPACANSFVLYESNTSAGDSYYWTLLPDFAGSVAEGVYDSTAQVMWNDVDVPTPAVLSLEMMKCGVKKNVNFNVMLEPSPPPVFITAPANACAGLVTFEVTAGAAQYAWDIPGVYQGVGTNPLSIRFPNHEGTLPKNYTVSVTASGEAPGGGCTPFGKVSTVISISPGPEAYASTPGPLNICGETIQLEGDHTNGGVPPYSVSWRRNSASFGAPSSSITTSQAGNYNFVVTDANGCAGVSNTLLITSNGCSSGGNGGSCTPPNDLPTLSLSGMDDCQTPILLPSYNSGASYSWQYSGPPASGAGTNMPSFNQAGIYTITYKELWPSPLCDESVSLQVTIGTTADFFHTIVCGAGNTYDVIFDDRSSSLNGWDISDVDWEITSTGTATPTSGSGRSFTSNLEAGETYTITQTVSGTDPDNTPFSCTIEREIAIPQKPEATMVITKGASSICQGLPIGFDVDIDPLNTVVASHRWTFGADNGKSALPAPRSTFPYTDGTFSTYDVTVGVTDIYGCTAADEMEVNIYPNVLDGEISKGDTLCSGIPVTLVYQNIAGAPVDYIWKRDVQSTPTLIPVYQAEQSGSYWVQVFDAHGCRFNSDPVDVLFITTPEVYISGSSSYCSNETVSLKGPSDPAFTYEWKRDGLVIGTGHSVTDAGLPAGSYAYQLTVTNNDPITGLSCSDMVIHIVTIRTGSPPPLISSPVVLNCNAYEIRLTGSHSETGGSFNWSNGTAGTENVIHEGGPYRLWFTNGEGCQSSADIFIPYSVEKYFAQIPSGCYPLCTDELDEITIYGPPATATITAWQWNKDGLADISGPGPLVPPYQVPGRGSYSLGLDNGLCAASSEEVEISEADCRTNCAPLVYFDVDCDPHIPGRYNFTFNMQNTTGMWATYILSTPNGPVFPSAGFLPGSGSISFPASANSFGQIYPGESHYFDVTLIFADGSRCYKRYTFTFPFSAPCNNQAQRPATGDDRDGIEPNGTTVHKATLSNAMQVYPNPSSGQAIVAFDFGDQHKGTGYLSVHDVSGRKITDLHAVEKEGEWLLQTQKWPSGVYLIRMEAGGELLHSRRLVVVH